MLETFSFVFSFYKIKGYCWKCKCKFENENENVSFTDYASGIGLPDWSKLAINRKIDNDVIVADMTSSTNFLKFFCFFCQV